MQSQPQHYINRRREVLARFGISNTFFHNLIKQGLMPPPIPLGARSVGWLQHELDAVLAAKVAGKDDKNIRALVGHLVDQRKKAA